MVGIASFPCCFIPILCSAQLHTSLSLSDSISDRAGSLTAGVWFCVCACYVWTPNSSCCTPAGRLTDQRLALMEVRSAGRSGSSPGTCSRGRAVITVTGFSEPKAQPCLSSKPTPGSWPQERLPLVNK